MVANEIWVHLRGLVGIPSKHINILYKKVYQLLSLQRRQLGSDLKEPLLVLANDNSFQLLAFGPFSLYLRRQNWHICLL